jgi:glycosyltransferase involved in cell wall biosynthesis
VLTFNNDRTIETMMKSVAFADEVIVIDSGSSDRTLEIVEAYTDRVISRPWPGYRDQYVFAQEQCKNDWLLVVDSDEEVSPKLAKEMREALSANIRRPEAQQVDGYVVSRRTFFVDRWIFHGGWVPDREVRLYHRKRAQWAGNARGKIEITSGNVAFLKDFIYHYSYADISDQIQTLNHYSTVAAQEMDNREEIYSNWRLVFEPLKRFCNEYFLRGGFRDGIPGLVIAMNNMNYTFNKFAKRWERDQLERLDPKAAQAKKPQF